MKWLCMVKELIGFFIELPFAVNFTKIEIKTRLFVCFRLKYREKKSTSFLKKCQCDVARNESTVVCSYTFFRKII